MNEIEKYNWMVCVRCMTFNHAPYIVDAMNGFTMQETTFPFVCCIVDDASTDGEQEVIKNYLAENFDLDDKLVVRNDDTEDYVLIFSQHKTNRNCFFAIYFLKYNHWGTKISKARKLIYISEWHEKAKYIAVCEGDDYWIASEKLQKQVVFLENNPDFVICTHDYIRYYENKKHFNEQSENKLYLDRETNKEDVYKEFSLDNYFKHWFTQPLTCLYRNGQYLNTIPRNRYKYFRDDIFYYYVLKEGKGALLKDVMGIYRINDNGTWSTRSPVIKWKYIVINMHDIYLVESDERAIFRMNTHEKEIVYHYLCTFKITSVVRELFEYAKMVPHSYYITFMFSLSRMVLSNILSLYRIVLSKIRRKIWGLINIGMS